tara:strand:+ start:86 stop:265 length:180 start_codon:yes stop_codon:yes gene_type:complete
METKKLNLTRQDLIDKSHKLKSKFDWHWARMHGCDKSLQKTKEIADEMRDLQKLLIFLK